MLRRRSILVAASVMGLVASAFAVQPPAEPTKEVPKTEETVTVLMKTSLGDITIELDAKKAPVSVANFLHYVDGGFYDGTIFHRVMKGFMVQGGGFDKDMTQKKTDAPIKNEWQNGLKNTKGTVAMARLGRKPDSATAQFFINAVDNSFLDEPRDGAGYAVFGKVTAGMDIVAKMEDVKVGDKGGHQNVPLDPIVIQSVKRVTPAGAAPAPAGKQ